MKDKGVVLFLAFDCFLALFIGVIIWQTRNLRQIAGLPKAEEVSVTPSPTPGCLPGSGECDQPCDMHNSNCGEGLTCVYNTFCEQTQCGGHCCRKAECPSNDNCICGLPPTVTSGGPTPTSGDQTCQYGVHRIRYADFRPIHTGGMYGVAGTWRKEPDCVGTVRIQVCQCDETGLSGCETNCKDVVNGASGNSGVFSALIWPESLGGACGTIQVDGYFEPNRANSGFIVKSYNEPCRYPNPTPSVRPTPTSIVLFSCDSCQVFDLDWQPVSDLNSIPVGKQVYFAVSGSTNYSGGITKARFRINSGSWVETTQKHQGRFYLQYTLTTVGSFTLEAMLFNPSLGWF